MSRIESATDNTGRDLLTADPVERRDVADRREFWSHGNISSDYKAALMQTGVFDSLALPAAEASEISLAATVVLLTGGAQREFEASFQKGVGNSFEAGNLNFTVQKIEPEGGFGRTPYKIDFRIDGPVDDIADIQFLDTNGQAIQRYRKLQPAYQSTGEDEFHILPIRLAEPPPDNARVRLSLWKDVEEVAVSVEVKYRLGIPSPGKAR